MLHWCSGRDYPAGAGPRAAPPGGDVAPPSGDGAGDGAPAGDAAAGRAGPGVSRESPPAAGQVSGGSGEPSVRPAGGAWGTFPGSTSSTADLPPLLHAGVHAQRAAGAGDAEEAGLRQPDAPFRGVAQNTPAVAICELLDSSTASCGRSPPSARPARRESMRSTSLDSLFNIQTASTGRKENP